MACAIGLSRILREDRATKDGFFVEVVAMTAWLWSCWDAVQYNGIRKENGRLPRRQPPVEVHDASSTIRR